MQITEGSIEPSLESHCIALLLKIQKRWLLESFQGGRGAVICDSPVAEIVAVAPVIANTRGPGDSPV